MDGGLLLARVVLAGVFGIAALAKLADRDGSRAALAEFGVPARLAGPATVLLPVAELAVTVALLLTPTARLGAVAAICLLLAFMIGIGINLARGRAPDCHCFGQLHSSPAGLATLVRNGVLAAIAALVVWRGAGAGGPAVSGWLGGLSALAWVVLAGGAIVALFLVAILRLLLQLMRQNGRLLSAFDLVESRLRTVEDRLGIDAPLLSEGFVPGGLAVGAQAPGFALTGLNGGPSTLDALRAAGKPVVLLFTDPGCGPCTALLPEISRWQHAHAAQATIVLVSRGGEEANRAKHTEFGVVNILMQDDREVAESYRVAGTPSGVLVLPNGTIGSPVAVGAEGIRNLVERIATARFPARNGDAPQSAAPPPGLQLGEPAPSVTLTDLEGDPLELSEFQGAPTAVLFWNPGCGFCQRMLADVKAWEASPPRGAPKLLVISTGAVETNRDLGLRSPLGLDEGFAAGRAFGAAGTPSAVVIDGDGRVASPVAVGADEVLELLRANQASREPAPA
jgi:peroxiredoxin